mmetsp:Transcript_17091/g.36867  ORF Transcript_17091/g.36867 Transcript_17091/m.36867 type:complete len:410 (-) Transcript_17091:135-1364(-)
MSHHQHRKSLGGRSPLTRLVISIRSKLPPIRPVRIVLVFLLYFVIAYVDLSSSNHTGATEANLTNFVSGTASAVTETIGMDMASTTTNTDGIVDKDVIKASRKSIEDSCRGLDTEKVLQRVRSEMFTTIPTKADVVTQHSPRPDVRKCKNVILDFGANVGDTATHVIDAGIPNCAGELHMDLHEQSLAPGKWNRVTKFLKSMMDATKHASEDYCYYGVEGNPVFTERLRGIEDYIHSISPKPVEHAAFFTESVGAGEVGMTKLYLDTVNTKENFWGSSIMQNHQDVRKSKEEGNMTEAPYHEVMGYTITKLMEMTLKGFDDNAAEEDKKGGHFLMKVDIEGGEYALTQEVVASKALCRYVAAGNTADVIIETHSQRVTGPNPLMRKFGGWKKELEECGVKFQAIQAYWA